MENSQAEGGLARRLPSALRQPGRSASSVKSNHKPVLVIANHTTPTRADESAEKPSAESGSFLIEESKPSCQDIQPLDRPAEKKKVQRRVNSAQSAVWAVGEGLWLLKEGVQLTWEMSFGVKWLFMAVRLLSFGFILISTFFQFFWWYMNSSKIFRRIPYRTGERVANATFATSVGSSNNRAYLDIHYPIPAAQVLRASPTDPNPSSPQEERETDGEEREQEVPPPSRFPVIVLITGGAWIVGSHFWSAMLARIMGDNGYLVVSPDYRNFPQATMRGMIDDVTDAISWVIRNISRFGGDPDRITLMGQSAGAHLLFLSVAEQLEALQEGRTPVYDITRVQRLVALSGLFDLPSLEDHLHSRGLYRQVLYAVAGGKDQLATFSPIRRIRALSFETFDKWFPRNTVFIHGLCDVSAPWEESERFAALLQARCREAEGIRGESVSWRRVRLYLLPHATHTSPFVEDPLLQKSQVVEILCHLDGQTEPQFHVRPAMAGEKRLFWASKIMPF